MVTSHHIGVRGPKHLLELQATVASSIDRESSTTKAALTSWLSSDRGIIVFLPAILFVTFCTGLGPGLLTTFLSGIALWYVFLPPYYSFALSLDTAVGLATFAFGSIAGVTLVHLLQVATARAKAEEERSA